MLERDKRGWRKYAPSAETSHFRSNLETSPQNSSDRVSQPFPETKKYRDFQSQKEEGKPQTTLDFLSEGKNLK